MAAQVHPWLRMGLRAPLSFLRQEVLIPTTIHPNRAGLHFQLVRFAPPCPCFRAGRSSRYTGRLIEPSLSKSRTFFPAGVWKPASLRLFQWGAVWELVETKLKAEGSCTHEQFVEKLAWSLWVLPVSFILLHQTSPQFHGEV